MAMSPSQAQTALLFYTPLCPFGRKVRLQLFEKKKKFRLLEENPLRPSEKLIAVNPAGTTPVFVENGQTIVQDYAIQEYLEETCSTSDLLGQAPLQRAEIRRLLKLFDDELFHTVTQIILDEKIFKRGHGKIAPDSTRLRKARSTLYRQMDYISWLIMRRRWLGGDLMSLADLSAAAQLSSIDYLGDVPWSRYPATKEWYMRLKSRPSFRSLLMESFVGIIPSPTYRMIDF